MEAYTIQQNSAEDIIEKYKGSRAGLIGILEEIQARFGYLPKEVLEYVADHSEHSLVDIYGVATFYKSFSLAPRGKHLCSVCLGTACHVRGGPAIAEEFQKLLKIKPGETTPDNEFTLNTVNCLGACALGPVVVVDGHYFSQVNIRKVKDIIAKTLSGLDKIEVEDDPRVFPIDVCCSKCNHSLMAPNHLIDNKPSIWLTSSSGQKHGWLRLSSLYGSNNVEMEHEAPKDQIADIFCPHCFSELLGGVNCPECGIPMTLMIVKGGGTVQICPRKGCKGHILDL